MARLTPNSSFGHDTSGQNATSLLDEESMKLATMVRPSPGYRAAAPQDIWDIVVDRHAELPGSYTYTVAGAMAAADRGDWPLCTYLAARCFRDGSVEDLSQPSLACHDRLWLDVVSPVVVHVPPGRERLHVHIDGHDEPRWMSTDQLASKVSSKGKVKIMNGSKATRGRGRWDNAEQFKVGAMMQPNRFKKLLLPSAALLELRKLASPEGMVEQAEPPDFLKREWQMGHLPGNWFYVLAYPLAGDLTKALLRPAAQYWGPRQRTVLQDMGETLMAKCAKEGRWAIVETLVRAGVPCPNLSREFEEVCGPIDIVRKQWKRDLASVMGSGRPPSLFELAAWGPHGRCSPLRGFLTAVSESKSHHPLNLGTPPLIIAAAEASRWDIVQELLDTPPTIMVSAADLLRRPVITSAPANIKQVIEERAQAEDFEKARCHSLQEYFSHVHMGHPVSSHTVPTGFQLNDQVLEGPGDIQVLDCQLQLGPAAGGHRRDRPPLAFVPLSNNELCQVRRFVRESSASLIPVNLNQRRAQLEEPQPGCEDKHWLVVRWSPGYLAKAEGGAVILSVPDNEIPAAHIVRPQAVEVAVVTPCCRKPLPGVPVYVSDKWAGITDSSGVVEVRLVPGRHKVTAPGHSYAQETVEVAAQGQTKEGEEDEEAEEEDDEEAEEDEEEAEERKKKKQGKTTVELDASGELFLFLQDMSLDDEIKDGIMLTANRSKIPDDAGKFMGHCSLRGCIGTVICVNKGMQCNKVLHKMKVNPKDGRPCQPNVELTWFEDFKDECQVSLLFEATPLRLAYLLGKRPEFHQSEDPPPILAIQPSKPQPGGHQNRPLSSAGRPRELTDPTSAAIRAAAQSALGHDGRLPKTSRPQSAQPGRGRPRQHAMSNQGGPHRRAEGLNFHSLHWQQPPYGAARHVPT